MPGCHRCRIPPWYPAGAAGCDPPGGDRQRGSRYPDHLVPTHPHGCGSFASGGRRSAAQNEENSPSLRSGCRLVYGACNKGHRGHASSGPAPPSAPPQGHSPGSGGLTRRSAARCRSSGWAQSRDGPPSVRVRPSALKNRPHRKFFKDRKSSRLVATAIDIGTDACSRLGCLSILITCWSCGRIVNAAAGTSTRHLQTCLSALTSAPGAAIARRTSCTASVRTAVASSSGAPSARPTCSQSTRHRPSGLSCQDALRHPPADPPIGVQEPTAPSPPGNGASGRPLPLSAYRRPRRIPRSLDRRRASRRGRPGVSGRLDLRCPPAARWATGTGADVDRPRRGRSSRPLT
jgi:hypothetical protein